MISRSELPAQWSLEYAQKCSEIWVKTCSKFPATLLSYYSMVEFARIKDAFSESFELEASSVKSQSLSRKDHTRRKKVKKLTKFGFFACPSNNVVNCSASGKNDLLLCCKYFLSTIGAKYLLQSPKCPKNVFLAKSSGSQWVNQNFLQINILKNLQSEQVIHNKMTFQN